MDWLNGTLEDAVKLAASKAVLARVKRADAAAEAEGGRRTLGYLGIPEGQVNSLASKYQRGELSRTGALARFATGNIGRIPGQIANLPSSVGTALGEGDVGGAAAQADVLGLKNFNPATNPLTFAAAVPMGMAGAALGRHTQNNRDVKDLLNGSYSGDKDPLVDRYKELKPALEAHRAKLPSQEGKTLGLVNRVGEGAAKVRKAYGAAGTRGALGVARKEIGQAGRSALGYLRGPAMPKGVGGSPGVERGQVETVLRGQRNATRGKGESSRRPGIGRPLLAGTLAASIPLMANEWLHPTGYRSGVNPFSKVLDANDPKRETR